MIINENAAKVIADNDTHEDYEFASVDFSSINLVEHSFQNCLFTSCRFRETEMQSANFRFCVFKESEFVLTKVHNVTLNDASFESCRIMGINFSEFNNFGFFPAFKNCVIDNSIFNGICLRKGKIFTCKLVDCDFSACDFSEADFTNTVFKHVTISQCNLEKADFRYCQGYRINPDTNRVRKAKFSLPEAQSFLSFLDIIIED